jgi:hypothetical protein
MKLILFYILLVTLSFANYQKVIYTSSNYSLTNSDSSSLIVTSQSKNNTAIVIPFERSKTTRFSTGTTINGSTLTDYTVTFIAEPGVTLISYENSFRSKGYGSNWELKRIGANTWVLSGDLYSLDQTAYVGDDVVIKAIVDQAATGPFTYVWYKNNVVIPGKTLAGLKLFNVKTSDSGFYRAKVLNSKGEVNSETTKLLVK